MSCSNCNSNPCKCGCSSVPFYNNAEVCAEDNCERIYQQQFYFSVCPELSWNVPACGFTSILSVPGVQGATVGSFLWHPNFGYFEITSVDSDKGQIGIVNNCTEGNASPGTQIPVCTCFVVTVPPDDSIDPFGQACVAIDFTAPAEDDCIDITVTTTTGLTVSDTVQIGTGFYFVDAIKPDNIITICNQGEGITPGTPVIAKDTNDNFQYCLAVISSNPCDREETSGKLLICDGEGVSVTLGGCADGYVPVVVDEDCNVELRPIGDAPTCTRLTVPLGIVAADPTYTLDVTDSSGFVATDILTIQGRTERFTVTSVPNGTQINVTADPTPGANATVPVDSLVCLIGCCEEIQNQLDSFLNKYNFTETGAGAGGTLPQGSVTTVTGPLLGVTITNTSAYPMNFSIGCNFSFAGVFDDDIDVPRFEATRCRGLFGVSNAPIGTAPVPTLASRTEDYSITNINDVSGDFSFVRTLNFNFATTIAAGEELRIGAQSEFTFFGDFSEGTFTWTNLMCSTATLAVAFV